MLKNYIVTAWKVFLRRKFFTFINLFGISLTLTVIMVTAALIDSYIYPSGPEKTSINYRTVERLTLTNDGQNQIESSRLGFKFIKDNIMRLKTPELISINTGAASGVSYIQGSKLELSLRRTDLNYWKILKFDFIQGRHFTEQEFNSGLFVAVINQNTERQIFGQQSSVGKYITTNNQRFQIIGVVENISLVERSASADIWVPYTTLPSTVYQQELTGSWEAILFHSNSKMLDEIHQEYVNLLKNNVQLPKPEELSKAFSGAYGKLENISRGIFGDELGYDSGIESLIAVISIFTLLFMLLPSINMINLNVSRILERSSEIGVRKAFGASSMQLVSQFVIESILLTIVSGIVAALLSLVIFNIIENSGLIPYATFSFNLRTFIFGLIIVLIFGIISGLYPAIKMSRLHPVKALKGAA